MLLVLFNKKPVNGVYLKRRPKVYRLSEDFYLVEHRKKQFISRKVEEWHNEFERHICYGAVQQLCTNISGLKWLRYVGTTKDTEKENWAFHYYLSNKELSDEEQGLVVYYREEYMQYVIPINYKQVQAVEIFTDRDSYIKENYCIVEVCDKPYWYAVINIETGEIIYFENVEFVTEKYIEQAIEGNKLGFLKKLAEMYYSGIEYLGKYNLGWVLAHRVSLEELWQEAQKAEVKEMLFNNYTWAVYNVIKALDYRDQVEGWEVPFRKYKVVYNNRVVIISRDGVFLMQLGNRIYVSEEEVDPMVNSLYDKYPICYGQLDEVGLKKWAEFLKSCEVKWVA